MNESELTQLVQRSVDREMESGNPVIQKPWLVHKIIKNQARKLGTPPEFYTATAYHAVSDIVRKLIQKLKMSEEDATTQLSLPGYERIQTHYAIDRDGPCIVAIEAMTVDELRTKAGELLSMASGLTKHAEELHSYADNRSASSTPSA